MRCLGWETPAVCRIFAKPQGHLLCAESLPSLRAIPSSDPPAGPHPLHLSSRHHTPLTSSPELPSCCLRFLTTRLSPGLTRVPPGRRGDESPLLAHSFPGKEQNHQHDSQSPSQPRALVTSSGHLPLFILEIDAPTVPSHCSHHRAFAQARNAHSWHLESTLHPQ